MSGASETPLDLVGGPWAVIESDPGVFTTLLRELGAQKLQLVELYDIEPWAVDHLHPHGLIFCFLWQGDAHRPSDFRDPAADQVWFANQLVDDGCASYAFLNVLMNCPDVYIGQNLTEFRADTEQMSPVMKGLAVSNNEQLRHAHNSLARYGSKGKEKAEESTAMEEDETYHFIGYVPAHGKVWELDGLKTGPLEVGEYTSHKAWMDTARPALRMKMERYGGSGANIRFSLLALVDSAYEIASDEYELVKKAKSTVERVLGERWPAWREKVS
ncbi:cysteine proteinase [Fistulina hepatica ATCC 64428]|uniref:Ubiquitin carboxyl-terminal hydrolase n=1 Tax=Fistulina hepatica ATCC 64428 TaxID=1128425 RepID=A0A0D7A2U7_9AGAR|nr:cysteine proteinase [Fistulina hepatica ATCC 64428]